MYPISRHASRGFLPKIEIVPCVGWASPAIARSSVVFPAPLSPRIAWKRPGSNSAETPRKAANRPNCLITFLTVMVDEAGTLAEALTARIYGFQGFFAKERIARDNTSVRDRELRGISSPETSSCVPATQSELGLCFWPAPTPELLQAAAEHISMHTWPAVAWHGTRHPARSCHRPGPVTRP